MKRVHVIAILCVCLIGSVSAYAGLAYTLTGRWPWSPPVPPDIPALNDPMNEFAITLYKELASTSDRSLFFSPFSIYIALAMAMEGARGTTAAEMGSVLGYEQGNTTMLSTVYRLWQMYNNNTAVNLSTANALWLNQEFAILDSYIETISTYFQGRVSELDFSDPEQTAAVINGWVEDQTHGRITDLVPPSLITPLTQLILTNAIYFKGSWTYAFNQSLTTNETFIVSETEQVDVPMMTMVDSKVLFNYTETDTVQVLKLSYTGGNVSMVLMLPKNTSLDTVDQELTVDQLISWNEALQPTDVDIYLPRFTLNTYYSLSSPLTQMGMPTAFSSAADFSGITGNHDVFISEVLHKAFVEVNEQGTEAAAATAVVFVTSIPGGGTEQIVFRADHPFLFLIQHEDTGNILFLGRIVNPVE
ncbi:MAG: serpin family protein [Candidatus Thermoplasmatota archaeon]|nr:serpin family protein [Candidatus Thermoplasmatota archaeon]